MSRRVPVILLLFPGRRLQDRAAWHVTLHGVERRPLNALDLKLKNGADGLFRIDIEPSGIQRLVGELWAVGITKTLIYPEPQSLTDDLKRIYEVS